jgi:hypothetical protein
MADKSLRVSMPPTSSICSKLPSRMKSLSSSSDFSSFRRALPIQLARTGAGEHQEPRQEVTITVEQQLPPHLGGQPEAVVRRG